MKRKLISILLAICLTICMTAGCSKSGTNSSAANSVKQTESATTSFTDSAGRKVEVPTHITKIAASGSMAQIVLFALAPEMLVGLAGKWDPVCEKYLDTKYYNLPVLGQFYGKGDLNLEEVAKVNPQIIIDVGESKKTIVKDMDSIQKQVGIPTVHIEATMDTMGEAYRTLGKLLGKEKEAEELAKYCEDVKSNTDSIMNKVGENGKTKVLYCLGKDGLNVLAKGSFHAEILDKVCNNVAVVTDISSKGTGNPVNMEQILLWNPDVIIFAPDSIYSSVKNDKAWNQLAAIKNGHYYEVPIGPYNWMGNPPSVNRYIGMIWITQLLYPDKAQYNLYDEAVKYYKLFYHCDLTEDQYKALVANSISATKK